MPKNTKKYFFEWVHSHDRVRNTNACEKKTKCVCFDFSTEISSGIRGSRKSNAHTHTFLNTPLNFSVHTRNEFEFMEFLKRRRRSDDNRLACGINPLNVIIICNDNIVTHSAVCGSRSLSACVHCFAITL